MKTQQEEMRKHLNGKVLLQKLLFFSFVM